MSISVILHIVNEDPVLGEIDKIPDPTDQILIVSSPRRKDGSELTYLEDEVATMIVPWHRVNFVEVMPSGELEDIITFVRE